MKHVLTVAHKDTQQGANVPASEGAASVSSALGEMPGWNLADLYPSTDSAELQRDLQHAHRDAEAFAARYQGKLAEVATAKGGAGLFDAFQEFEALQDVMGRIGSFAFLNYVTKSDDPARAKFFGDCQEKLTNIGSQLLFFTLELNRLDDALVEGLMADIEKARAARAWKPLGRAMEEMDKDETEGG